MISPNRTHLSTYMAGLLSMGEVAFLGEDAARHLGTSLGAFQDAAERLQRRGQLIRLRNGFYVIVPAEFQSAGAPPPPWYIDELMHFEWSPYYVGLLSAAELHLTGNLAAARFQVVAQKQIRPLAVGQSRISFHYCNNVQAMAKGIRLCGTPTGRMKVSCVELTALDLVRIGAGGRHGPCRHHHFGAGR